MNTQDQSNSVLGRPLDRVDGRRKVMGAAPYAAEFKVSNVAYAMLVQSTIAKGTIRTIDTAAAERAPGVVAVFTHKNMPRLGKIGDVSAEGTAPGEQHIPLQDATIHYAAQNIALVVAESYEQARFAASLVRATYDEQKPALAIEDPNAPSYAPEKFFGFEEVQDKRGDAAGAMATAQTKVEQTYSTPVEHHNPLEPPATIAQWDGDRLTIYNATQAVIGTQKMFAGIFKLPVNNVRVISPFVGGGFGCKGLIWLHPALAAVAARELKRPVKLALTRQQMFTSNGHRGRTVQRLSLGAARDGKLTSIRHLSTTQTSPVGDFFEPPGLTTRMLYACPNLEMTHTVKRLNLGTPTPMRAPGESPGTFALESAMDELAYQLKLDPLELRLINHADVHPHNGKAWSSKHLKDCYRLGAEKFGWANRKAEPRAMKDGRWLIGYGMATATYPGYRSPASARATIKADGSVLVQSATQDIGTGTYTVMAQVAADTLGVPIERVKAELGDSSLPPAPTSGGSTTVASVAPAVKAACEQARAEIVKLALAQRGSKLFGKREDEIAFANSRLFVRGEEARGESYADILKRAKRAEVAACVTAQTVPPPGAQQEAASGQQGAGLAPCSRFGPLVEQDADQARYAFQSFGAQFAEVRVDEDLGVVRVARFTSVQDIGRVINEKMARSQVHSGVIYGIGMALMEETVYDQRNGRNVVRTLADYHFPANADVPAIDVHFIGAPDPHINSIGSRGVGEIGITGVAAAIANAVFHATGKRVRDLPITPDKLL